MTAGPPFQACLSQMPGRKFELPKLTADSRSASRPTAASANNTVTLATRVNRPPTANAGPDQIVSAGTNCQTMVALNGTASSDPDGDTLTFAWTIDNLLPPPILLSPTDPPVGTVTGPTPTGPLPLGTHTIMLTVNDGHGGTASDTVVVTVRDVAAPTFSGVPAPVTIEQSSQSGATFSVSMPPATDNCSGSVVVSSNAPATFPPGPTTVTFSARDAAGNSATATTTVTVVDTRPPMFSGVPPPMTVEQTGPSGTSLVVPKPTANDSVSGSVIVSSNAPAIFPRGVTTVTFTARDAAGNSAVTATTVTVVDTVSPTLVIASPQARAYLHPDVVIISFSATDAGSGLAAGMPKAALDGTAVANGQSVNTLTLSLGAHNFVLSAVDVAGNSRSQNVAFTVIATIDSLIASVNVFAGQQKIDDSNTVKSLLAKLNDAKQAAERGNKTAAINKLAEFMDLVRNQSGRHIASDAAQILVADAQYVIGTLQ
jgi:large repetitive protein